MNDGLRSYNSYLLDKLNECIKESSEVDFGNAIIFIDLFNYYKYEDELGYTNEEFEDRILSCYERIKDKVFILSYKVYLRKVKLERLKEYEDRR